MNTNPAEKRALTKKELIGKIDYWRKYARSYMLLFAVLLVLWGTLFAVIDSMILLLVLIFGSLFALEGIFSLLWRRKFGSTIADMDESDLRSQIIREALKEGFQFVRFDPKGEMPRESLPLPWLTFTKGCSTYIGSNYASGQSVSTPVEAEQAVFGYLKTYTETTDQPHSYSTYQQLEERFNGMLYRFHLDRAFPAVTLRTEKQPKKKGETLQFEQRFSVLCNHPEQLSGLLTPGMKQFLTESAGRIRGRMYIHFAPTGDVYLAFHQKIYDCTIKKGKVPFQVLETQLQVVNGLIRGLTGGF